MPVQLPRIALAACSAGVAPGALLAACAAALAPGAAPSELRLLPAGRFRSVDGRPQEVAEGWHLDAALAARLVDAAAARRSDYVIDYEHQTLRAQDNGRPAPAAGWFKNLAWRDGDGLYATDIRWNEAARKMIADGEYRYLSPVFSWDKQTGDVLGLAHAALTNFPGLDGLTDLSALAARFFANTPEGDPMNELLKKLLATLGLQETTTEADALSAVSALKAGATKVAGLETEVSALKADAGKAPDPAQYVAVATMKAVTDELAALKAEKLTTEVNRVVTEALSAGKLLPAQEAWARELGGKDLAALSAFVATAVATVKPGTTQTGGKPPGKDAPDATDANAIAQAALAYQAAESAAGREISVTAAVQHIIATAGK